MRVAKHIGKYCDERAREIKVAWNREDDKHVRSECCGRRIDGRITCWAGVQVLRAVAAWSA
eukprot:5572391-Lingulodinium_polyedra.AAC.1